MAGDPARQAPEPPLLHPRMVGTDAYLDFLAYLESLHPGREIDDDLVRESLTPVFVMGLNQARRALAGDRAHMFEINGRRPRRDMMVRLGLILARLKASCPTYPLVPPVLLRTTIARVVGRGLDKRYINKYQDWIVAMSTRTAGFNRVDLTYLADNFPANLVCEPDTAGGAEGV